MQKKYQVFISSTYNDLIEERNDIAKAILELDHIPSGMETFLSADEDVFTYIQKIIDQCDYYVLIIAGKYGAISSDGLSYTEKEYDYAKAKGKVILAFINNNTSKLPLDKVDTSPELKQLLEAFVKKASSGRLVTFWSDRDLLRSSAIISLHKAIFNNPGVGWVRANVAASEDLLSQINNLRVENDALKAENETLKAELDVIKAQLVPELSGLADLDDFFVIHYSDMMDREKDAHLTWSEIFVAIAPSMMDFGNSQKSYSIDHIADEIVGFLRERYRGDRSERSGRSISNNTVGPKSIMKTDLNTILFHFFALGLVEFIEKNTVLLTAKGRKTLVEVMAVRKKRQ